MKALQCVIDRAAECKAEKVLTQTQGGGICVILKVDHIKYENPALQN